LKIFNALDISSKIREYKESLKEDKVKQFIDKRLLGSIDLKKMQ